MKTAKGILSEITGIPKYRLNDDMGQTVIKSACLLAMQEFAEQEAEKAFNAARESMFNTDIITPEYKFKDYKTYKNSL